jgi:hypothetical protein
MTRGGDARREAKRGSGPIADRPAPVVSALEARSARSAEPRVGCVLAGATLSARAAVDRAQALARHLSRNDAGWHGQHSPAHEHHDAGHESAEVSLR